MGASVKGVVFERAVSRILDHVGAGRISEKELETRLEAEDIPRLDEKIEPVLWYPIATLGRLDALHVELVGADPREEMRRIGRQGVLLSEGNLAALVDGARSLKTMTFQALTALPRLLYDFGEWTIEHEDLEKLEVRLVATDMKAFPETSRYQAEGTIETLAVRVGKGQIRATSERPTPDRIVFDCVRAG